MKIRFKPILNDRLLIVLACAAVAIFIIAMVILSKANLNQYTTNSNFDLIQGIDTNRFVTIRDCYKFQAGRLQSCLDQYVQKFSDVQSMDTTMLLAELERARLADRDIENDCHPI